MDRATRLRSLWSWLPAFRAVAETQHLPTASDSLHVSASSLSRTIRLLEEDVGQPLFDRVGRQLVLNGAGEQLLRSVRDAMRRVDDAIQELGPGRFVGRLLISVPAPFAATYVLPALAEVRALHPKLLPSLNSFPQERLAEMLKQGDLDLAIFDGEMSDDVLTVVRLTEITHGLFCGPRHPLATIARPTLAQIQAHPFVAPAPIPGGRVPDQWPPHLPRTIGLEVNHIRVGIEACQEGSFLAVLPVPLGAQAGLVRLPARGIGTSSLCAMHRETLGDPGPVDAMVTALRRRSRAV